MTTEVVIVVERHAIHWACEGFCGRTTVLGSEADARAYWARHFRYPWKLLRIERLE